MGAQLTHRAAVVLLLVLGCASPAQRDTADSSLPSYAVPTGEIVDPEKVDTSDVIPYRALVRGDFKGDRPPAHLAGYVDRVGAATCAHILTTEDTQLILEPIRSRDGGVRYRAIPHVLRFRAQMDRKCSWWNPKSVGLPESYILEHEQIHFALFELRARALNAGIPEFAAHIDATSKSPEAATRIARRQLEGQLQEVLNEVLARNREFDEDTSMGHHPEEQKRWWNLVHSELSASAAD